MEQHKKEACFVFTIVLIQHVIHKLYLCIGLQHFIYIEGALGSLHVIHHYLAFELLL